MHVVNLGDVTIVPVNTLDVYRELLSAPTVEVPSRESSLLTTYWSESTLSS